MYTNILIPTDGSELAGKAVEHGFALVKRIGAKATVQPALPFPDGGGHGPQVLVSDLQRREAEQIAGASFRQFAGNLPRHRQRPGEATPKWPGLPGQVDRQLLAWRSILVRTERLPQLHRLRDHSSHCTLRHWQRREVEHLLGFEAIRGLWITRLLRARDRSTDCHRRPPPSWP